MSGHSEELLAGLTPEEIEALKEDDGADDKTTLGDSLKDDGTQKEGSEDAGAKDGTTEAAEAGKTDDADASKTETGKVADAAAGADAGKDAGARGADAATEEADANDATAKAEKPAPLPLLVAEVPANAEAKLKEISDKKGELLDQFDNGDITAKEYQSQLDALNRDERTIERQVEKAQTAAEMNAQQQKNTWLGQVQDFTSEQHPEYSTSKSRWIALDAYVKEIANDAANAHLTGTQILAKAHELVVKDLGEVPGAKKETAGVDPKTGKPKVDDKAGKPLKGAKVEPPQTLAKVPAAEHNSTEEDGRWAALDRLGHEDPMALEEKLMKMSAEDRDAYLAAR